MKAKTDTKWLAKAKERHQNNRWLTLSFKISVKILRHLRENKMSQKSLAEKMNCSPQYLNKMLKGKENLTLETICKLEDALEVSLIAVVDLLGEEKIKV